MWNCTYRLLVHNTDMCTYCPYNRRIDCFILSSRLSSAISYACRSLASMRRNKKCVVTFNTPNQISFCIRARERIVFFFFVHSFLQRRGCMYTASTWRSVPYHIISLPRSRKHADTMTVLCTRTVHTHTHTNASTNTSAWFGVHAYTEWNVGYTLCVAAKRVCVNDEIGISEDCLAVSVTIYKLVVIQVATKGAHTRGNLCVNNSAKSQSLSKKKIQSIWIWTSFSSLPNINNFFLFKTINSYLFWFRIFAEYPPTRFNTANK